MTGLEGVIASLAGEGRYDQQKSTISIDYMGLVNQLRIDTRYTETMSDLTNQFVANVQAEARGFNTVVLAFDNYGDETQVGLFKQCRHGSIDIKTTLHSTIQPHTKNWDKEN